MALGRQHLSQRADASGAELFASTGDNGAYVDEGYSGSSTPEDAQFPASEPYVTAVGGTTLSYAATTRGIGETAWGQTASDGAGSGCDTFDLRPAWQASANTGCSGRAVSDLSADASPYSGLSIYDSYSGGGWQVTGGTSLAAPLVAAFTAVTARQQPKHRGHTWAAVRRVGVRRRIEAQRHHLGQ